MKRPQPLRPSEKVRERLKHGFPEERKEGLRRTLGPVYGPFKLESVISKQFGKLFTLAPTKELMANPKWGNADRMLKGEIKEKVGARPFDFILLQRDVHGNIYARITSPKRELVPCFVVRITAPAFLGRIKMLYPTIRLEAKPNYP